MKTQNTTQLINADTVHQIEISPDGNSLTVHFVNSTHKPLRVTAGPPADLSALIKAADSRTTRFIHLDDRYTVTEVTTPLCLA
jgi:hypothetical protein